MNFKNPKKIIRTTIGFVITAAGLAVMISSSLHI